MSKVVSIALVGAIAIGLSAGAMAAQQHTRIRGTIDSLHGSSMAVQPYDGHPVNLMLQPSTKFASVVPATLSDIKPGDFVGVGATGPKSTPKALEVVIFPESMRGTGEGHYAWSVPATVAHADRNEGQEGATGGPPVQGTMTNGTVATAAPASGAPPVQGTMTNGTVASNPTTAGGTELTISYNGGKKIQILVPPNAPVVRLVPATQSALTQGSKAFVVASKPAGSNELAADFVAVGKDGLMPPM